jgi:peptidoglycan/LPS O-acetylase OafA/YrhL
MAAMTHKIPELDGLRAVAILAVMVTHFSHQQVLLGGYLGVDLFFVLSGFLITSLLLSEERAGGVGLGNFYARRALRILPPLLASAALALALGAITWQAALAAIFFVANIGDVPLAAFVPMWSLSVEEHFYLLWPFLFIALGRHRPRFVGYAILAVVATRVLLLSMKIGVYEQTYARADSLLVGCGAALLLAQRPPRLARWIAPATFVTVMATFALMPWRSFAMMSFGFTILAFVCAALILSVLANDGWVGRLLRRPAMQYVGKRSYGLYVYHAPMLVVFERMRVEGDLGRNIFIALAGAAASFAVAEISYRTLEAWARRGSARFRAQRGGFPELVRPEMSHNPANVKAPFSTSSSSPTS